MFLFSCRRFGNEGGLIVSQGIDLLRGRNKGRLKVRKQAVKIKLISFLVLGLYLVAGSGLFVYLVWAKGEKSRLQRSIQVKKQRIIDLKKNELLHLNLKQRLAFLNTQLDLEQNLASRSITTLSKLADPQVTITSFSFVEDGQVVIAGEAANALILSDFFEKVKKEKKEIEIASLTSLTRMEEGSYEFNLNLKFKGK